MRRIHILKCHPNHFHDCIAPETSRKTFDIRYNDRCFMVQDILIQREYEPYFNTYTNRVCIHKVTHLLPSELFGFNGFKVMSVKLLDNFDYMADTAISDLIQAIKQGEIYA